jgi:hypothetical protein
MIDCSKGSSGNDNLHGSYDVGNVDRQTEYGHFSETWRVDELSNTPFPSVIRCQMVLQIRAADLRDGTVKEDEIRGTIHWKSAAPTQECFTELLSLLSSGVSAAAGHDRGQARRCATPRRVRDRRRSPRLRRQYRGPERQSAKPWTTITLEVSIGK